MQFSCFADKFFGARVSMQFTGSLAFASISEKDIDLLLLEEFCCSSSWIDWFYAKLRSARVDLPELTEMTVEAARSVSGLGEDGRAGETDVLVVISGQSFASRVRIAVLIEDKISATFTPDQPGRYANRAIREMKDRQCEFAVCVLVAPARYAGNLKPEGFDLRISLEEILQHFAARLQSTSGELTQRIQHRIHLLEKVCHDLHRYGSVGVIPHEGNTRLITAIDNYIIQKSTALLVKRRSVRGANSYGPGFDLPSKARLREAARSSGESIGPGSFEIDFNWLLAAGVLRIRFHHWVSWVPVLKDWWISRLAPGVRLSTTSNGKSLDLEITGLPAITDASDSGAAATLQMVDQWIDEAARLQAWFESHAIGLVERLNSPAGKSNFVTDRE